MRVLVCVHGTCNHQAGFSDPWMAALAPFLHVPGQYEYGTLGISRFEVLWSDLISDTPWLGQRWAGCSAGFFQYFYDLPIRLAIINRFNNIVRPLLDSGHRVDVLAHSEGTIIAYEALCRIGGYHLGSVLSLFTVGTALGYAWDPFVPESNVRNHLLPSSQSGSLPSVVSAWWNIFAEADPFASPLAPAYEVTQDFGPMPAVGCDGGFDPVCVHNSYFNPDNTAVLRDIIASKING